MVNDILDDALEQFTQDTALFGDDEQKARYFDIAVRNGYDTAGRRDSQEATDALREAVAVLKPVAFPDPAPRTLRAVGLTAGMIDEHLHDLHDDEEFVLLLKEAIKLSVQAVAQWDALAQVFSALLAQAQE